MRQSRFKEWLELITIAPALLLAAVVILFVAKWRSAFRPGYEHDLRVDERNRPH